jgi:hypothetical protein
LRKPRDLSTSGNLQRGARNFLQLRRVLSLQTIPSHLYDLLEQQPAIVLDMIQIENA